MENTKNIRKLTYCFLVYGVLYALPFPVFSFLLWGGSYETEFNQFWFELAHFINFLPYADGKNSTEINLTGDTIYHYFKCLVLIFCSLAGGFYLSRSRYNKTLAAHAHIFLRIFVGSALISYGMAKVLPAQFGELSLLRLYQPLGEMTPMSLLWSFMSYSKPYLMLTGWIEVIAGVLIFIPWTYGIGCVLSIAVMSHVFLLNMFFDVPVKLFSFHLLIFSIFLSSRYVAAIGRILISSKEVSVSDAWGADAKRMKIQVLQYLILLASLFMSYKGAQDIVELKNDWKKDQKHYGVWEIESKVFDWYQIIFHERNIMTIQSKNGKMLRLHFREKSDGIHKVSEFVSHENLGEWELKRGNDKISLVGSFNNEEFRLEAKKVPLREHPLLVEKFKFSQDHAVLR